MKKILLIAIAFFIACPSLLAQINKVRLETRKPALYEKTNWDISLISTWSNPYLQQDVALNMMITTPSGKHLFLPCYYASGKSGELSQWRARFTPQETGEYEAYFELIKSGKKADISKSNKFFVKSSDRNGFLHPDNNWVFRFDNGKTFRGIGENIGWESRTHDDSRYFKALNENTKFNYYYLLTGLKNHGGNFFRTWICQWNLPIDWHNHFNRS